jgi:hypothetical protein
MRVTSESLAVELLLAESDALLTSLRTDAVVAPRVRNVTRERRHQELQFLRRHVVALTHELQQLQRRSKTTNDTATDRSQTVAEAWERLAQRQLVARQLSEGQQRWLWRAVGRRTQLLRSLHSLLFAYRSIGIRVPTAVGFQANGWDPSVLVAAWKPEALKAFAETERVVRSLEFPANERSVLTQHLDAAHGVWVARLVLKRVFPFDVHTATAALWRAMPAVFSIDNAVLLPHSLSPEAEEAGRTELDVRLLERRERSFAVSYSMPLAIGSGEEQEVVALRVCDAVTRYGPTDANQSVLIWQTALDTSGRPGGGGDHGPIHGCGWLVLEQNPSCCRSAVLQIVSEFRTRPPTDPTEKKGVMEAWVALGDACMENVVRQLDKQLLV